MRPERSTTVTPAGGAARSVNPHPRANQDRRTNKDNHAPERAQSPAEQSRRLWEMTPAQRQEAMWAGELSGSQLLEWAKRAPTEVPLIEGEFAFIAARTPEVAEVLEPSR